MLAEHLQAMWTSPLLYERLTWPEVRRAAEEDRVCLIPVATLEDHGPHLPLDTDLRLTAEIGSSESPPGSGPCTGSDSPSAG